MARNRLLNDTCCSLRLHNQPFPFSFSLSSPNFMAAAAPLALSSSEKASSTKRKEVHGDAFPEKLSTKVICIKTISESPNLASIPSSYVYSATTNPHSEAVAEDPDDTIPVIDFSLLTSASPEKRAEAVSELGRACRDWGFFMVVNHGVPECVMREMIEVSREFFDMSEEEKGEFDGKDVLDPIRHGTSFNSSVDDVFYWRDYLKIIVHPIFHSPNKPSKFSEISEEYCKRSREVTRELLRGISESLGLGRSYMEEAMNLDSGLEVLVLNLYPPCPQPEKALGMPPHSDHGLLTLLIQNGIGGLQIYHNDKWINVNALPNSFLFNTADHLEENNELKAFEAMNPELLIILENEDLTILMVI